jgi:hypothetical protein
MELHQVSKLVQSPNLLEELLLGYACDVRIACILYPKRKIMHAQKPRTVPVEARWPSNVYNTSVNIFDHRLNSFGSCGQHKELKAYEVLRTIV